MTTFNEDVLELTKEITEAITPSSFFIKNLEEIVRRGMAYAVMSSFNERYYDEVDLYIQSVES